MLEPLLSLFQASWSGALFAGSVGAVVGAAGGLAAGLFGVRARATARTRESFEHLLSALERSLRGEPREAFEVLRREAQHADAPPAVYFAMAAALRRMGLTERSAQIHRGLLARGKMPRADKIRAKLGLAVDYLQLGRAGLAEELLRELPRGVRRHPSLLSVRRKTAIEARDWEEALVSTSLMVRRGGRGKLEVAEVYARMGEDALGRDEVRQALRSFRRALRRDDDNLRARHGIAELYRRERKDARARKHLLRILEANPALAPLLLPAVRSTFQLDQARDRNRYVAVLEKFVHDEQAALWIGLEEAELLLSAGKSDECRKVLDGLLSAYPGAFEVQEAMLNYLVEVQADDEALRQAQKLVGLASASIPRFRCGNCGYVAPHGFFECPSCGRYGRAAYFVGAAAVGQGERVA